MMTIRWRVWLVGFKIKYATRNALTLNEITQEECDEYIKKENEEYIKNQGTEK